MKFAFIDVGELGWSMYVNAHIRWHRRNTNPDSVAVITYPDRRCLYGALADIIINVPKRFYEVFDARRQNCLGLQKINPEMLRKFFLPYVPKDHSVPSDFILGCRYHFGNRLAFEPYLYSKNLEGKCEILIFPRCRTGGWYSFRNLPEAFYAQLIKKLCDEFPQLTIRTVGTAEGAYALGIEKKNYVNSVGKNDTLQDMIDRCQSAVATVGSQSAPPKIALLQGVPTFMIGHQKQRHMQKENWMGTSMEFYRVPGTDYANIDIADCIEKAVAFVKSNKREIA